MGREKDATQQVYFEGKLNSVLKSGSEQKFLQECNSKSGVKCINLKSTDDEEFAITLQAQKHLLQ